MRSILNPTELVFVGVSATAILLGACSNSETAAATAVDVADAGDLPTETDAQEVSPEDAEAQPDVGEALGDSGVLVEMANGSHTLVHGGLSRTYLLYQPENLPPGAPLVIAMHGYTGSAEAIQEYSGLNRVADAEGFVVAYPQGTVDDSDEAFFNVGYAFHDGVTVDDVGFIRTLVATLTTDLGLDTEHVFATGLSNGGEMSYMLACQAADVFHAVASVAGVMFESYAESCEPTRAVSVLEIHGTNDSVNWYEGDPEDEGGWGPYWGTQRGIDFWAGFGSLNEHDTSTLPDSDDGDGSTVVWERYWSADSAEEVWLYRVVGGGHDWPGAWGNMDIESSNVVWEFFSRTMDG